jgi:hypothetical protein
LVLAVVVVVFSLAAEARASIVDVVTYGHEGELAFRSTELALGERVPYRMGMNIQGATLNPVALATPLDSGGGVVEFGPIFGSLIRAPLPPKPSTSPLLGLTAQSVLPQPFVEAVIMPEPPVRQFALTYGGIAPSISQSAPSMQSGGIAVVTIRGTAIVAGAPIPTPLPGALWFFGSGVAILGGVARVFARRVRLSLSESSTKEEYVRLGAVNHATPLPHRSDGLGRAGLPGSLAMCWLSRSMDNL